MGKPEKDFDAVRMMRDIRDRLSRELEGKSAEEQKRIIDERVRRGWPGFVKKQTDSSSD